MFAKIFLRRIQQIELNVNKQSEETNNSLQVILIIVFGSRDCCDKITVPLPFKVRILVNPFALSMNNLLNVSFSSQEPSKLPWEILVTNQQFETTIS